MADLAISLTVLTCLSAKGMLRHQVLTGDEDSHCRFGTESVGKSQGSAPHHATQT